MSFHTLPPELLYSIGDFVDKQDILQSCLVCRAILPIFVSETTWRLPRKECPSGYRAYRALKFQKLAAVQPLLERWGADINAAYNGFAPPMLAAEFGCVHAVNLLLNYEFIDSFLRNQDDETAMSIAIRVGSGPIVKRLLGLPNIELSDLAPANPCLLKLALDHRQHDVFQLLLADPRTNFNAQDSLGRTPLHHAIESGDHIAVQMLLDHGKVGLHGSNPNGNDALSRASKEYDDNNNDGIQVALEVILPRGTQKALATKTSQWIPQQPKISMGTFPDNHGFTPLARAAEKYDAHLLSLLLKQSHAQVNARSSKEVPPLWVACRAGDTAAVNLVLCQKSIEINQRNPTGTSSIQVALAMHHLSIVQLLLHQSREVAINDRDSHSWTLLMFAAAHGHHKIVERVLKYRTIEVNLIDDRGRTALWYAAAGGHLHSVRLLVEHPGTNSAIRDFQDKAGQDVAKDRDHLHSHRLLQGISQSFC